jgi:hypothetical protein
MKKRWDEALRSLARRTQGDFRALGYGVTGTPEEVAAKGDELLRCLVLHGFLPSSRCVIDVAAAGSGASDRPRFRTDVLEWIERSEPSRPETAVSAAGTRDQLRAVSTGLAELFHALDSGSPRPLALRPDPAPRAAEAIPIVIVERFEDLGADAEAIGAAVQEIVGRGAHLVLPAEGIDTRSKEGRGRAAVVLRLADIRASAARERSLRGLEERRSGLEVYGPIPFGFERLGRKLNPIPRDLEAVTRARELSGRGLTRFEIALALNREGRSWKDGTPWTGRRVELVLRNPIYDRARREEIA